MFLGGFITGCVVTFIGLVAYSCSVVASRYDQKPKEETE